METILEARTENEANVYSVSQLNREVRKLLEGNIPLIWISGEISNYKRHSSGHVYFSLKDQLAQVRCAMFRMRAMKLNFEPKDGSHVLAKARVSLYEERGDYQLIVEQLEEAGDGVLQRAFEALKKRLAQEGLFDAAHKKLIPPMPRCIGVITSPTGAAIRDILTVLKRRFPSIPVIIYPTAVQGAEAAPQITAALQKANQRQECDVIILARGGGSLEDLWPFNEEIVARAIHASTIPIISGVGHEVDFTIADFVADQRAATPSAAAELASPQRQHWLQQLANIKTRLQHFVQTEMRHINTLLHNLEKRLQHPGRRLEDQAQRLDHLENQLIKAQRHLLHYKHMQLQQTFVKLQRYQPTQHLQKIIDQQQNLSQRLWVSIQHQIEVKQQRLANCSRALDTVSPLNTLKRGYAIVTKEQHVISRYDQVKSGDKVVARLGQGYLSCTVDDLISSDPTG